MPAARFGIVVVSTMLALCGCASISTVDEARDRTGGIALDLLVEWDDGRRAFYQVSPDGVIGYGGGNNARARRTTWTGTMTDPQIERLVALIDENEWRERQPPDGPNPDEVTFRITLRSPDGRHRYVVRGKSPTVMPAYDHLQEITMQRFDRVIETLPQPSEPSPSR